MAFSNIKRVDLGGGLAIVCGDFTNTVGAADQTFAIGAGRILHFQVNPQATAEPVDFSGNLYGVSISGAINTVTIRTEAGITAGTFWCLLDQGGG
jgi:hypothetical protein